MLKRIPIWAPWIIAIVFVYFLAQGTIFQLKSSSAKQPNVERIVNNARFIDMTFEDSVYMTIIELRIKHPDVVLKQAIIESGNFGSDLFMRSNNMFGFRRVYSRPTTQIGVTNGYGVYNNWRECIIDYALYQVWSGKGMTKDEYIQMLGVSYAEDPEYINKIK